MTETKGFSGPGFSGPGFSGPSSTGPKPPTGASGPAKPPAHHADVKEALNELIDTLHDFRPLAHTRERALAVTKLQEAIFWLEEDMRSHP